jgi:hypothetical protein
MFLSSLKYQEKLFLIASMDNLKGFTEAIMLPLTLNGGRRAVFSCPKWHSYLIMIVRNQQQ